MYRYSIILAVLLSLFLCTESPAITDEEVFRNFQFFFINPGARSSAMGGAFIGLADDATAAEANPAGLTILTRPEVSLEYRNTKFDEQRLNSFNFVAQEDVGLTVASFNTLEERNQPSFLSVVFPSEGITYAFSRQEVLNTEGTIDEIFIFDVEGQQIGVLAAATTEQKVVNWNFSVGMKISDNLSLGGSARYSQLDITNNVENTLLFLGEEFFAFETSIEADDSAFAWNVGALYRAGKHLAFGAVYKKNPKFDMEVVESGPAAGKPGTFPTAYKIPDVMGFGVSLRPNDNITISADIVRIEYSDLTEDFEGRHNIITQLLSDQDPVFNVDDEYEFHVGTEFVVFIKNYPVALRQGYYHRPSSTLLIEPPPGTAEGDRQVLEQIFPEREDEHHFTLGSGFVFGQHFQLDWAIDLANSVDNFVLSSVVRF